MNKFHELFGIDAGEVRRNCIVCPVNDEELFCGPGEYGRHRGLLFRAAQAAGVTVISAKNNFLVGDCVLHLKDTSCQNVFLFGSCAGCGDAAVGDKVLAQRSFSLESFTEMAHFKSKPDICMPDESLNNRFLSAFSGQGVQSQACATVGSIALEESYHGWFLKNRVSCIDMETSIVFSAANYIKRRAMALLYVTDLVKGAAFTEPLAAEAREKVLASRRSLAAMLAAFTANA